ncbi:MAG TPA: 2-dehydropantoate 2-reductase N-terminal domain-containing protein, partial [Anaerolineaceae bacterium]
MRFLILGAGAIGAYVGGSLALAGQHEVVFFVRPDTAAALHSTGLTLQMGGEIRRIASPATVTGVEEFLACGPYDAAVLAVKSYDTRSVLEPLTPWRDRFPPLLCLQNGVENEALIASLLGEERVIPGSVTTSVSRPSPGLIRVERLRGVAIAAGYPLSQPLAEAFEAAGLHPQLCR